MKNTPMTVINLRIPTSQLHAIKNEAENDDLTTTQLIRRIIKRYMQDNKIAEIAHINQENSVIKAFYDKEKIVKPSDLLKCVDCNTPTFASYDVASIAKWKCDKCK